MDKIINILQNSIVIDAHFDLLFDVLRQRQCGRRKVIETDYLAGFIEGGINTVVCSIYINGEFLPEMALRRALNQISALYCEIHESSDKIMLCKNYDDIIEAKSEGKIGIVLSFEGVEPLYNDLSLLRVFYELGVRIVGLTWSRRNYAADGCLYSKVRQGTMGGITDFGVNLIETAENLGMFIDVSHLNDEGFWNVLEIAKKPIIASHSNCRALTGIERNLTDEQIKAIASKGGVIGINASNILVAENDLDANIEYLVNHVEHISKLVGVEYVGLGFDFCNQILKYLSPQELKVIPRKPFDVLRGHKKIKDLVYELIKRDYKQEEIELILGKNFLRVYMEVFK